MDIKATKMAKVDESVLGNWRSQVTGNGVSTLDYDEIIFPPVHVGSHQLTSVLNQGDQPVALEMLLNSGEIINKCRGSDEILQPHSYYSMVFNDQTTPSRYGFSVAGNAVIEVYIHSHGKTYLGSIVFHPSSRRVW